MLLWAAAARADHGVEPAWKHTVSFSVVTNTGIGYSLYVVGNQPELGNWRPSGAVRLAWSPGNVWSGRVAVRAGATVEVQYIRRLDAANQHCENTNVIWPGMPNATSVTPVHTDAPYPGKTIFYHSAWTSAFVLFSIDGSNFTAAAMDRIGSGRFSGEYLHRAAGFAIAGRPVQFVCYGYLGGTQYWDNAPYPGFGMSDYYTSLDVFFLQDGQIFNYWPPPNPSLPTIVTQYVHSTVGGISGRTIRIYVPRGYANNTWKRYPVVYMHDGQNVFHPGGPFGSWGAEHALTREISQGRAREALVVGVDNSPARCIEYLPPEDTNPCSGSAPGIGHLYGHFLNHNVKPTLDFNYRTLGDRPNTFVVGSSLGGLISSYLVLRTNIFSGAGVMSPSFWAAPNFRGWIFSNDTKGVRLYLDGGTDEGPSLWNYFWPVRVYFIQDGYVERDDILTLIGCGHTHSESAWSNRLAHALRYLLNPWREANILAESYYPAKLEWTSPFPTSLSHRALAGFRYRLEASTNLVAPSWYPVQTSGVHVLPWSVQGWQLTNPPVPESVLNLRSAALAP